MCEGLSRRAMRGGRQATLSKTTHTMTGDVPQTKKEDEEEDSLRNVKREEEFGCDTHTHIYMQSIINDRLKERT